MSESPSSAVTIAPIAAWIPLCSPRRMYKESALGAPPSPTPAAPPSTLGVPAVPLPPAPALDLPPVPPDAVPLSSSLPQATTAQPTPVKKSQRPKDNFVTQTSVEANPLIVGAPVAIASGASLPYDRAPLADRQAIHGDNAQSAKAAELSACLTFSRATAAQVTH